MDLPSQSTDEESRRATAEGVAALDRAIAILDAFTTADRSLSLAEIAARTGLYKSTILRLANSLLRGQLLDRAAERAQVLARDHGRKRVGRVGTSVPRLPGERLAHPGTNPVDALVACDCGEPDIRPPRLAAG